MHVGALCALTVSGVHFEPRRRKASGRPPLHTCGESKPTELTTRNGPRASTGVRSVSPVMLFPGPFPTTDGHPPNRSPPVLGARADQNPSQHLGGVGKADEILLNLKGTHRQACEPPTQHQDVC